MTKLIQSLLLLLLFTNCKRQPEMFEFKISGTISGLETGYLYFNDSGRSGDEIKIPVINKTFEYEGKSPNVHVSYIGLQDEIFPVLIEPGEIVIKLNAHSLAEKSFIVSGPYNIAMQETMYEYNTVWAGSDFKLDETKSKFFKWISKNNESFLPILLLSSWESMEDFMPVSQLQNFLNGIHDKNLRKSSEFVKLYSIYLSKKDSINSVGKKATNFSLPDVNDDFISFNSVAKNKLTFVEKSGSWCGNSTQNTRELKPIYNKYKGYGFEIITIVPESKHERWQAWNEKEKFPWVNLVELDTEIVKRELSYSSMLFRGLDAPNYLVNEHGVVIACNISSDALKEHLMKQFEPEAYNEYIKSKWDMSKDIYILDREQAVNSFSDLVSKMSGKPFLIDCWATWCTPCLQEFEYNKNLKAYLESNDIEVVYINFDRPEDESKWLRTIEEHNLQGYHFRNNDLFSKDLACIGYNGMLPAYMIVNKNGKVVENSAFRPSQSKKLYNQIERVLKINVP